MTHPTQSPPAKPRKHLMTPGRPRPQPARAMSLTSVQRWVMSTLIVSTGLHMAAGLVFAAYYVDKASSTIGLLVISGALGLLTMAAGLLVHKSRLLHPLMLVGLLPPAVGVWWLLG